MASVTTAALWGSLDAGAFVISVSAFQRTAGTSDAGLVAYNDATGHARSGQGEVTFNEWGPIGTVLEGTYAVPLALVAHPDAGPTLSLSGSFRVCHAYDAHRRREARLDRIAVGAASTRGDTPGPSRHGSAQDGPPLAGGIQALRWARISLARRAEWSAPREADARPNVSGHRARRGSRLLARQSSPWSQAAAVPSRRGPRPRTRGGSQRLRLSARNGAAGD